MSNITSSVAHLQLNIDFENLSFYADLLQLLGWKSTYSDDSLAGFTAGKSADLWFGNQPNKAMPDYDQRGLNHLAFKVDTQAAVDATVAFLEQKMVEMKFETPRHRPEFSESKDHTYYQVMFTTPDNILIEVVYTGPKQS